MRKLGLLLTFLSLTLDLTAQSEFKKYVDSNSKDLPFDDYSIQVIKANLVNFNLVRSVTTKRANTLINPTLPTVRQISRKSLLMKTPTN